MEFQREQYTQRNRGVDLFQKMYLDGTGAHSRTRSSVGQGQKAVGPPGEAEGLEADPGVVSSGTLLWLYGAKPPGRRPRLRWLEAKAQGQLGLLTSELISSAVDSTAP